MVIAGAWSLTEGPVATHSTEPHGSGESSENQRTRVAITSVNQLPTVSIVPNILEIATLAGFKSMSQWGTC